MSKVIMKNVSKVYSDNVTANCNVDLEIEDKELVVFVGPSASGKSTALRMIAGLEEATVGEIYLGKKLMNGVKPKNRNVAMIFPNYTLYPNMTVEKNMEYLLKTRDVSKKEIEKRIKKVANKLSIQELLDREPNTLTPFEKQRISIAKAELMDPQVILIEEPFKMIKEEFKDQMIDELIKLHKIVDKTFICAMSNPTDAKKLAEKIVVMKDGKIRQVGKKEDIDALPNDAFVAEYMTSMKLNLVNSILYEEDNEYFLLFDDDRLKVKKDDKIMDKLKENEGRAVIFAIMPEDISVKQEDIENSDGAAVTVDVIDKAIREKENYYKIDLNGAHLWFKSGEGLNFKKGKYIDVAFDMNKIHLFDKQTEKIIF